ncbi:MAG TPA: serine hydrolase [Pyrinomonadaceae bacterium]|jgi:CubicO group peptidase (beta-lactamase class C family)
MHQKAFRLGLLFLLLFIAPLSLIAQTASTEARLKEIDEYALKAGQDWKVPGFAIAIVKDDKVIFARGYGVRKLGEQTPVDEHTLFAIASNTKAFTAAAIAILVDEGKLKWDDPATKYLPGFQLYDPYVTRELTVRDLLSHRSGLATFGGDLIWYDTTYKPDEILRRVRYLKPTSSFRSRYGYQNIMFLAAGQIVRNVTGKSWEQFVQERFLTPLGMASTKTSITAFKSTDNVAAPHNELDGKLRVVRYSNVDGVGPAAALNSSVADMAQWIRLQLGRGKYEGKQLFSAKAAREMWSPQTIIPISEQSEKFNPTRHFNTYGLGWFLSDYHGRKVASHGGGLDGMISQVGMMPEENLGVVVLTNSETPLASFMVNKVFDTFLGVPARDWSAELLAQSKQAKEAEKAEEKKLEGERAKNTKPSLPLQGYAGTYGGEMYGEAKVTEENGHLILRLVPAPNFVGDLEHWQYDTFRIKWRDTVSYPFPRGLVTFTLNAHGKVDEMKMDVPNPDFDFKELEFKRTPEVAGK